MKNLALLFTVAMSLVFALSASAQQSSKSKARDKLYEKGELQQKITVKNTNLINTEHLEFSPAFYHNGLVFISTRNQKGEVDEKINEPFFELFYAEFDRNGMPMEPEDFSVEVNSQLHEGPVTFNKDGNEIYFTRNNLKNGVRKADGQGVTRLKIYSAKKGYFDWEEVKELSFNSDDYSVAHPSLSPDGKKLFFTSDMPGGMGGMDLYYVEKLGDDWSEPRNLGPKINTSKNEAFPFIHGSGTLFFSSNGHSGLGALDIFKVDISKEELGDVFNLGEPFNSNSDDLGFIMTPDGRRGYFASDRDGGFGKDDIYFFEIDESINVANEPVALNCNFKVYDNETNAGVDSAAIRVFERTEDGFLAGSNIYDVVLMPAEPGSNELALKLIPKEDAALGDPDQFTDANGEAHHGMKSGKSYVIMVSKPGYLSKEVVCSTAGKNEDIALNIPLEKPLPQAANQDLQNGNLAAANQDLQNGNLAAANQDLQNGNLTDNAAKGKDGNETLDNEGANVNANADATQPYDATQTGAENTNNDPRAETTANNEYETLNISDTDNGPVVSGPVIEGSIIILENIYYDFNKSAIRSGAARELDALVALLKKYPSMEVELIAHTDCRGEDHYNQKLSYNRAVSAMHYLVARGIDKNRIKAFGYGETQLRNHCDDGVNCSEKEHQYNRRTEVRVSRLDAPIKVEYGTKGPEVIDGMHD